MVVAIRCEGESLGEGTGGGSLARQARVIRDCANDLGEIVGGRVGREIRYLTRIPILSQSRPYDLLLIVKPFPVMISRLV